MTLGAKMEYLEKVFLRYKKATREQKTLILNEFCTNCSYHRKYAIRKLHAFKRFTKPKPRKRGKPSIYNKISVIKTLKRIWLAANLPCSKRLKAIIPLWLPYYDNEFLALSQITKERLLSISPSTIDRVLKPIKIKYRGRGRTTTKPGTLLRNQIPIKTDQWNETHPGFVETDTVAHCGTTTEGMYALSIDLVDIATAWTEQRAVWGKGEIGVLKQLDDIEKSFPVDFLGFDADNGSEFLNHHLYRHFVNRKRPIQFTRSRAYKKDDNAHIEQKNWTHVRQWLGYTRFDNPEVVPFMNDLYKTEWRLYQNFFLPSVKLIEKKRVASKVIKRYDKPKTPYQRVLESKYVSGPKKDTLKERFKGTNPFKLKRAIIRKIEIIHAVQRKFDRKYKLRLSANSQLSTKRKK